MYEDHNDTIYEILQAAAHLMPEQLDELKATHESTGVSFAQAVIDAGELDLPTLLGLIAETLGYELMDPVPASLGPELTQAMQASLAKMYGIIPVRADATSIDVLAKDPFNNHIIDDLTFTLNKDINIVVGDPEQIENLITETYGASDASVEDLLKEMGAGPAGLSNEDDLSEAELASMASDTSIIRFVDLVLEQAVRDKASDIHFEPFEDEFRLRYRIDGALYEMAPPPRHLALPVISRVKVLSNLNISERRIPQDGRIKMTIAGHPIDLRVSTLPTQFGESVVLRVLDKSAVNLDLEMLSMADDIKANVRKLVDRPNGIFIVTGPTGSGKTTTLYSALREVNKVETKILTAEDPVEYEIEGIMQTGINHAVGLSFAAALRSFLRQDPDKIMVGEIRDLETAQIAVQASLTGHVVLSTLHTNDSAGTVTRLVDMGIEPFLIAASLEGILAQRLVRKIDPASRTAYEPDAKLLESLDLDPLEVADRQFFYGSGTPENPSGYKGRQGLFELLLASDRLRELITENAPTLALRQKAIEEGMRTLREDGIRAIFDGLTTIEEVLKYT